jgi:hypothetical protein
VAFDTGVITSATPNAALATKIKALFGGAGVANWSFVENIPAGVGAGQSGSAAYTIDVYKCAGTGTDANAAATDFYVALRLPVADGAVSTTVYVFEDYEGGVNKRFRRPCASGSLTAPTGAGFWRNDTYATTAASAGAFGALTATLNTTGFEYWIKLTNNMLWVSTRVGAIDFSWITILGDSMVAAAFAADPCPLFLGDSADNINLGTSREPGVTDATVTKWFYSLCGAWTQLEGSNVANNVDLFQGSKVALARVLVRRTGGGAGTINLVGNFRALLKADLLVTSIGGTFNVGDTIVVNGVTYVCMFTGNFIAGSFVYVTPNT